MARDKIGEGTIGIHDRKRQHCRSYGRTFSTRRGTMLEGLRKPTALVVIVVNLTRDTSLADRMMRQVRAYSQAVCLIDLYRRLGGLPQPYQADVSREGQKGVGQLGLYIDGVSLVLPNEFDAYDITFSKLS